MPIGWVIRDEDRQLSPNAAQFVPSAGEWIWVRQYSNTQVRDKKLCLYIDIQDKYFLTPPPLRVLPFIKRGRVSMFRLMTIG